MLYRGKLLSFKELTLLEKILSFEELNLNEKGVASRERVFINVKLR